jgi:O-antigen ligase
MVHSLGRQANLTGRPAIWAAVLSLHTSPLVGAGFESFWMGSRLQRVWDMTEKGIQEAHDGYLEVYINLGIVGVSLLAGLIVSGYRNALAVFRRDRHAGRLQLAFFTAGVIYSITEAGFRMMCPMWIGFLLSIVAIPPSVSKKKGQPRQKSLVKQVALTGEDELVVREFV